MFCLTKLTRCIPVRVQEQNIFHVFSPFCPLPTKKKKVDRELAIHIAVRNGLGPYCASEILWAEDNPKRAHYPPHPHPNPLLTPTLTPYPYTHLNPIPFLQKVPCPFSLLCMRLYAFQPVVQKLTSSEDQNPGGDKEGRRCAK